VKVFTSISTEIFEVVTSEVIEADSSEQYKHTSIKHRRQKKNK
jgi:hypothetical protein